METWSNNSMNHYSKHSELNVTEETEEIVLDTLERLTDGEHAVTSSDLIEHIDDLWHKTVKNFLKEARWNHPNIKVREQKNKHDAYLYEYRRPRKEGESGPLAPETT